MPKFRKKPIVIEAVQWTGMNAREIKKFCLTGTKPVDATQNDPNTFIIPTPEGKMEASKNDWITKGVEDEFYPCKPNIFEKTYDPVSVDPKDRERLDKMLKDKGIKK